MADIKEIAEQVAQYNKQREKEAEFAKKTVESLQEQRDIQREIAIAAKATSIPYDSITNNIGNSLKELTLFEKLEQKLNVKVQERRVLENNLLNSLAEHNKLTKNLNDLSIQSLNADNEAVRIENERDAALARGATIEANKLTQQLNAANLIKLNAKEELQSAKELHRFSLQDIKAKETRISTEQKYIDKLKTQNKLASIGTEFLGQMGDLGKHIAEGKFPDWTDVLKKGIMNFLEYDKAAFGLRKSMGILRGDFDVLQKNVKTLGVELQDLGVSFEQVAASTTAIANEFNMFVASNKELVKDISVVSAQLGIAESDSAKFLKTMSGIANTTSTSQKGMIGFAKSMSNAAGVPLPAVMKDVAEASDDVRIFTGKSALNLVKGAIEARQMGTTLQNMANSAKKMLDFQTSIADEMEASVLLGRDVNFEQARNLAYRKDIVGANKAILDIAKKVDFDAMDPYQAEAFAKASGKSVQELQEMLQADKEIEHIRRNGTVEQKAQLEKMEQMKRMRADEAKDVGKMAEQRLREQANQERVNQLQNQFNKLMSELAQPVMDVVEPLLDVAVKILPVILKGFKALVTFGGILAFTGTAIAAPWLFIIKPINAVIKAFRYANSSLSTGAKIMKAISAGGTSIGRSFGFIGKVFNIFGKFGRFLGPLGLVITAFQFISNLMKRWGEFVSKDGIIVGGLKAIGYALYDTLIQPFVDAYKWVASFWGGNSPSELGLRILDGIKSVGGMILDALTLPFRTAFNFVSGLFGGPKLPKMSDVVFGTKDETSTAGTASGSDLGTIIAEGNKQVVAKLDELITLMSTGGIAVHIDGSKASMLLARAQKERGAFGAI